MDGGELTKAPRAAALAAFLVASALVGSIQIVSSQGGASVNPTPAEIAFGKLASGSSVGANATNGSASVAGSLVGATNGLLYLNNTNASGAYYAKLVLIASSGLNDVTSLTLGINNGSSNPQVTGSLGAITQSAGSYVRLEPGSTNTVYVSQLVGVLQGTTTLDLEVYVADDASESAYYTIRMRATVT